MKSYIFELSVVKNPGKVNYDKLYIELATSIVPIADKPEGMKGKIFVFTPGILNSIEEGFLNDIIAAHDGEVPKAFDSALVQKRENIILQINQMGIYHPSIDNDTLVEYLTSIDNWINAFVRSGNPSAILKKIYADSGVKDIAGTVATLEDGVTPVDPATLPYHTFLHTVSNPISGSTVFQFFASKVLEAANF